MILKAHNTCFYSDIARTPSDDTVFEKHTALSVILMDLFVESFDTRVLSANFIEKFYAHVINFPVISSYPTFCLVGAYKGKKLLTLIL